MGLPAKGFAMSCSSYPDVTSAVTAGSIRSISRKQASPSSCGKERLEDTRERVYFHTHAGIRDFDDAIPPLRKILAELCALEVNRIAVLTTRSHRHHVARARKGNRSLLGSSIAGHRLGGQPSASLPICTGRARALWRLRRSGQGRYMSR